MAYGETERTDYPGNPQCSAKTSSPGGAVAKRSSKPIFRAIEAFDKNIYAQLQSRKRRLQFCYDLVNVGTSFQRLKYVLNAGHAPLRNLEEEEFLKVYGLPKTLTFQKAEPREAAPTDIWSILY